jgi:hypothetical protein
VFYPSIHYSGEQYRIEGDLTQREVMPEALKNNIAALIEVYKELKEVLGECKSIIRNSWYAIFEEKHTKHYHNTKLFRGMDGRKRHLALMSELKANGATKEVLHLVCMLIFGAGYDYDLTDKELRGIKPTPWKITALCEDKFFC